MAQRGALAGWRSAAQLSEVLLDGGELGVELVGDEAARYLQQTLPPQTPLIQLLPCLLQLCTFIKELNLVLVVWNHSCYRNTFPL